MNKKLLTSMVLALAFIFATPADARPGKGKGKGHWKQMMKELDLTEDQKVKMKALKKSKPDHKASRENMKKLKDQLKAALKSDTSDADLIKMHGEIQTARNKKATERFNHMLAVRAILTPEQREKFHEMREKKRGRRGHDED